jgi:hypothetical protein
MSDVRTPSGLGRAAGVVARFVVIAIAFGVLGFAIGGFVGIIMTAVTNATGMTQQSMLAALWVFAIPGGVFGVIAGAVITVLQETRWKRGTSGA